jgi:hypothetical protein
MPMNVQLANLGRACAAGLLRLDHPQHEGRGNVWAFPPRASVSANRAAIPPCLIASEPSDQPTGSHYPRTQPRPGRFQIAEGETVFSQRTPFGPLLTNPLTNAQELRTTEYHPGNGLPPF